MSVFCNISFHSDSYYPCLCRTNKRSRTILALYDSSEYPNEQDDKNLIHYSAEAVLNYLGLKVRYHDIQQGLPDLDKTKDIYGVLSWFLDDRIPRAKEYCQWAVEQIKEGKKFIILGHLGARKDSLNNTQTPESLINTLYESLGLRYEGNWTDNPFIIEIASKDSSMVEFEKPLKNQMGNYEKIVSIDNNNQVYLALKRRDVETSESAVVVTTPQGGYAMREYEIFLDYPTLQTRWRINPFRFFEEAFELGRIPRFDTTTLFGRRILYSHIDGDGFRNVTKFDQNRYAGEIVYDEILQSYPWPITVSFITAEIDPQYLGSERLVNISREIFKLPHVEAGSHAFSHPLDWNNQLTAFEIKDYSQKAKKSDKENYAQDSLYPDAAMITVDRQVYLNREIKDAVNYINQSLLPPEKKVKVYQWSGDCKPPEEAIAIADRQNIENINGGDSRFDRLISSYSGIAPLTRQVKNRIQVYTSNANENIYTNGWTHPFWGFKHVIETFRQTEIPDNHKFIPRRLSPINIYYHFYIAERKIGLESLRQVYDYVAKQPVIPIFTSDYIKGVKGFLSGQISRLDDNGWALRNYGFCRTVRFDNTKQFRI